MSTPSIKDLIKNNLSIPTLPDVVLRINQLIENPDAGTAEIGALVSEDAPLAAKVLRIANSAYYGLSGECVSTAHASTVLGVKVLKNIVTQVAVINQFSHLDDDPDFSIAALWDHASFTAHLCSKLAEHAKVLRAFTPEELYVCGLLHDVGKVVLLDALGDKYLDLARKAREEGHALYQVERAGLGFTHCDVGSVVANRWGLPDQISKAIQYHHGPRDEVAQNVVVSIVAHANLLAHRIQEGSPEQVQAVFDPGTCEQLGLTPEGVSSLIEFAGMNRNVKAA
jgi:putative nucleotidyltransferase with HDIG domain